MSVYDHGLSVAYLLPYLYNVMLLLCFQCLIRHFINIFSRRNRLLLQYPIIFVAMIWKFERSPEAVARLRRVVKRSDRNWTVRLKYNVVCVMRRSQPRDARSKAQLECRERFRLVNERVAEEFKDVKRQSYWRAQAKKHGYKTARGYARAYFMKEVLSEESRAVEQHVTVAKTTYEHVMSEVAVIEPLRKGENAVYSKYVTCQTDNDNDRAVRDTAPPE